MSEKLNYIGANVPRLARRSPKPLGWVRFPTVPAIFLGVAQLVERQIWDLEAAGSRPVT